MLTAKIRDSYNDREEYLDSEPSIDEWYAAWLENNAAEGHEAIEDLADLALEGA